MYAPTPALTAGDFAVVHAAYGIYLLTSIALTVWVARVLSSTGETFLVRCFGHDEDLARSTNRLLVIGFYLVNMLMIARMGRTIRGWIADYGPEANEPPALPR